MSPPSHLFTHDPVVLVVDDQEPNVRLLGTVLAQAGYEVVPAMNGIQALQRIEAVKPDLILLDLVMPGMDGLEFMGKLDELDRMGDAPVIMLTAHHERERMVAAFEAGVVDFITKPFVAQELLARVKTHLELKFSHDRLERLLQEREDVVAMVAHDLKNPLSSIQFSAELLDQVQDDAQRQQLVELIRQSCGSGLSFIQRFLETKADTELLTQIELGAVSMKTAVRNACADFVLQAKIKNIEMTLNGDDHLNVKADPGVLHSVLQNLISNALKFSPKGAAIEIVWAEIESNAVQIVVRDHGPGISDEDQVNLFKKYMRLSAKPTDGESSSGLGLALAKRQVVQMGGELYFEPRRGGGSRFIVELPSALDSVADNQ